VNARQNVIRNKGKVCTPDYRKDRAIMIGPKQTTNEQMSNETKPTMGHESSAQSPGKRVEENREVMSEREKLLNDGEERKSV
jgi:hypothetical protein